MSLQLFICHGYDFHVMSLQLFIINLSYFTRLDSTIISVLLNGVMSNFNILSILSTVDPCVMFLSPISRSLCLAFQYIPAIYLSLSLLWFPGHVFTAVRSLCPTLKDVFLKISQSCFTGHVPIVVSRYLGHAEQDIPTASLDFCVQLYRTHHCYRCLSLIL